MSIRRQALCCECGNLRTFERARNYRMENYWFGGPINNDWNRETGDLKCSACGRVTRHALLHSAHLMRDHAETLQQIALGFSNSRYFTEQELVEVRRTYRQAFPRNPFIGHRWWKSAENDARQAGHSKFPAMCGEMVDVPKVYRKHGSNVTDFDKPSQVDDIDDLEFERLDVETGMYWNVGECVNCLAYRNAWLINNRRKELGHLFIKLATSINDLTPEQVEKVWSVLQEIPCDR